MLVWTLMRRGRRRREEVRVRVRVREEEGDAHGEVVYLDVVRARRSKVSRRDLKHNQHKTHTCLQFFKASRRMQEIYAIYLFI